MFKSKNKRRFVIFLAFNVLISVCFYNILNINTSADNYNTGYKNIELNHIIDASDVGSVGFVSTSARSSILIDTASKNIICEKNAGERLPMASTTKIMTAITALESGIPLETKIKITAPMTGIEGTSIYLYTGEIFTLQDLLYALLLNSANDAAAAIAISVGGSIEKFADMMNEKLHKYGLTDTNFTNPHGLHNDMHYTTAHDLAVITANALENEFFKEMTSSKTRIIYPLNEDGTKNSEGARFLRNHNRLLSMYPDCIGIKTGFTKKAGRCLVSAAEKNGIRLVAVTLDAPDDWNDHKRMLDFGLSNYKSVTLCDENQYSFEVDIINGMVIQTDDNNKLEYIKKLKIASSNSSGSTASLPISVDEKDIKNIVELPRFIYAPVKAGDIIGRVKFFYDGKIIGYTYLTASEDVDIYVKKNIFDKIKDFFIK